MTYKFYYSLKDSDTEIHYIVDASNIHEALREFGSFFCRFGLKPHYVRAHYWTTNDKGRTSTRAFKPSLVKFLFDYIDDFYGLNSSYEAV